MIPSKVSPQAVTPAQTSNAKSSPAAAGISAKDDFKKLLDQTTAVEPAKMAPTVPEDAKAATEQLKFSGHAIERMKSRGISFAPDELKNIQAAIGKAAGKGSKDTLVLSGDSALIVSVKNNTVVTVMDKALMKDNVFTNIDSTIVL